MTKKSPSKVQLKVPRVAQILYQPARVKGLYGGRGGGKSTAMADALVVRGVREPIRWLCCREIQKSLKASVHQLLADRIKAHGLESEYHITQTGIRGHNGTEFLFAGLWNHPDSIKSMEGLDGAWIEEADRCSQTSLDLLTPTLRKETAELWASWNRRNATDPIDAMLLGGKPPPRSLVAQMNWRQNKFFPNVLREEMLWMKERDRDKWLHVWEGHLLQNSEARVFKNWREDDLDDEIGDAPARFGADWGMRDPTVLVKIYRLGSVIYVAEEVYKIGAIIDETPALFAGTSRTNMWNNRWQHPGIDGVLKAIIIADSASPQIIRYLKDRGFSIRGAVKGPGSVEEGIEFMQSCDIVVHPRCKHCIQELNMYAYKTDPHTEEVLPELEDKDNHVIDAIRYALEGERRNRDESFHGGIAVSY